jgi:predicted metal-dependent phosphotriesterase family hydrolase
MRPQRARTRASAAATAKQAFPSAPLASATAPASTSSASSRGCDLGHIVISHSDDAEDIGYLEELIDGGSFVGMVAWASSSRTSDQRADMVPRSWRRATPTA